MTPSDPLFPTQWGLKNTGQQGGSPGIDINVAPVWATDTGSGVRVVVMDDGVQLNQPDLAANIDIADSYDSITNTSGGGAGNPVLAGDRHGTAVAGIIGEVANNGIGGSGVAPGATLISERIPLSPDALTPPDEVPTQDGAIAAAFQQALAVNADVINNSWGPDAAFVNDPISSPNGYSQYIAADATSGRGGKGTVILFANGNERAEGGNGEMNGTNTSQYVIAVAAIQNNGAITYYSNPGANLLVSAPGGGEPPQIPTTPGNAITTTDRTGTAGYNTQPSPAGDYTYSFNGTSAATPFVSGVVALMLAANPNLGYRDVQQILAYSARITDPAAVGWTTTGATNWNGGGLHFSNDEGFGLVNAQAAVELARSYALLNLTPQTAANQVAQTATNNTAASLPLMNASPLAVALHVTQAETVQHVDLRLNLNVADASKLTITLTSPSGTTISLMSQIPSATEAWPSGGFTLGTDAFWGESAAGGWTAQISDNSQNVPDSFVSAAMTIDGAPVATTQTLVLTDDFATMAAADPTRATLSVTAAGSAFDAAATASAVVVDLSRGTGSIGGAGFTLTGAANLANVIGGDGNDVIVGDTTARNYVTGRGDTLLFTGNGSDTVTSYGADTIVAGSGAETIAEDGSNDLLFGGTGSLNFANAGGASTVVAGAGSATLFGGGGGDLYAGGAAGNNLLVGGTGSATLLGGGGADTLAANGAAGDVLAAASGNATLIGAGSTGNNLYFGNTGNDVFAAGAGADTIVGLGGASTVFAGSGADLVFMGAAGGVFSAGSGSATVVGSASGADLYGFTRGQAGGADVIFGFRAGVDHLSLQGYGAGAAQSAISGSSSSHGSQVLTLGDGTQITLVGVTNLTSTAFV